MSFVQKIMGRGSTGQSARERAQKTNSSKLGVSHKFRVLNRDKLAQLRGSAPELDLGVTSARFTRTACSGEYQDLGAALAAARAEYARTLENVVVITEAGDVVLELGLE